MAYAIVHQFPGGTKEQYEKSVATVHPSDGSLPDGQIFHAAGASPGGWTVIAVEGGFTTPPSETVVDVQTLVR